MVPDTVRRFDAFPASGPGQPGTVVAITDPTGRHTLAVLVDGSGLIQRLQAADAAARITTRGSQVSIRSAPVEGGVLAYFEGRALDPDTITVSPDGPITTLQLPSEPRPAGTGLCRGSSWCRWRPRSCRQRWRC